MASCGGTPTPAPAPAAPAEQPTVAAAAPEVATEAPAAAAGPKTELVLMGWSSSPAENERLQTIVDQYNAATPDVNVTLSQVPDYDTKLQVSLAGGSPPDVFYVDSFKFLDLQNAEALANGNDLVTDPADFVPNLKAAFTKDGQFYCPPKDFSTLALQYNKDLFDAAGLAYPTADWTWQDMEDAAAKLTDKDKGVYGMVVNPDMARWLAFLYQAGGSVYNEDATKMTINSPEAKAAKDGVINELLNKLTFGAWPSVVWLNDPRGLFHIILGAFGVTVRTIPNWMITTTIGGVPLWSWISGPSVSLTAIMILNTWTTIGTMMLIFVAALQDVPLQVYEAAAIDGANAWQTFRKITLPLLRPTTFFVVTLGLIGTFQVFDQVYVMSSGGPAKTTLTIAYMVYREGFRNSAMGIGATVAIVLFFIIFAVTMVQRRITEGREA